MSLFGRSLFILTLFTLVSSGCSNLQTRGNETSDPFSRIEDKAKLPLKVYEDTLVLDARTSFAYGLGHWSEAIHFPWEKLSESESTGQLLKDTEKAQRSLSLIGIDPQTPVIVVGDGLKGQGEEGRLAWSLIYYGVVDVQTVAQDGVDIFLTKNATRPPENKPVWTKDTREEMRIGKEEFLKKVMAPRQVGKRKVLFIDVRSKDEYFAKQGQVYLEPDIQALHMEWKEFFQKDGRPDLKVKNRLRALGYSADDEIIVFSRRGVRSAAAAYSLIANGFDHVRNFVP